MSEDLQEVLSGEKLVMASIHSCILSSREHKQNYDYFEKFYSSMKLWHCNAIYCFCARRVWRWSVSPTLTITNELLNKFRISVLIDADWMLKFVTVWWNEFRLRISCLSAGICYFAIFHYLSEYLLVCSGCYSNSQRTQEMLVHSMYVCLSINYK